MNIAYYLPSIPVLLLFGQVEKLLDAEFGPTTSMAMRLMAGGWVVGCVVDYASAVGPVHSVLRCFSCWQRTPLRWSNLGLQGTIATS